MLPLFLSTCSICCAMRTAWSTHPHWVQSRSSEVLSSTYLSTLLSSFRYLYGRILDLGFHVVYVLAKKISSGNGTLSSSKEDVVAAADAVSKSDDLLRVLHVSKM